MLATAFMPQSYRLGKGLRQWAALQKQFESL